MRKLVPLVIVLFTFGVTGMTGLMLWSKRIAQNEDSTTPVEQDAQKMALSDSSTVSDEASKDVLVNTPEQLPASKPTGGQKMNEAERRAMRSYFSQVFANMRPEDAAEIFQHMNDAAVREALVNIPARRSAAILSYMPRERAAKLSDIYFSTDTNNEEEVR